MKNAVIYAITFIAGASIGGASAYFVTKKMIQKKADYEIESVRDRYRSCGRNKCANNNHELYILRNAIKEFCTKDQIRDINAEFEIRCSRAEGAEVVEFKSEEEQANDEEDDIEFDTYNYISSPYRGLTESQLAERMSPPEDYPEEEEYQEGDEPDYDPPEFSPKVDFAHPKPPYIIDEDEFAEDIIFEKVTITYYEGDDTLCDTDESIMKIEDIIGREALDEGFIDDILYVRNEKLGIDYEVVREQGAYSEIVLGLGYESSGRERFPKKRRFDDE